LKKDSLHAVSFFIATGCLSGLSPYMPGTLGTFVSIPFWYLLLTTLEYYSLDTLSLKFVIFYVALAVSYFSIWYSQKQTSSEGASREDYQITSPSRKISGEDPQHIVIDEWMGMLLPLLMDHVIQSWYNILFAFLLFRFFDITKPSIIKKAENLPGTTGIIADDIVAGIFAMVVLWFISFS
jgi:phosphatidylglycerophosphatase A